MTSTQISRRTRSLPRRAVPALGGALAVVLTLTGCSAGSASMVLLPAAAVAAPPAPKATEHLGAAPTVRASAAPTPEKEKIRSTASHEGSGRRTHGGRGPGGSRTTTGTGAVALTFDDGPDPVQTPKILALLARYRVHATFCLVGRNVAAHPDLVRRIVADGHSLCNHSWNHSLTLGRTSHEAIMRDLRRTNTAIHAAAPGAPIHYFRAPGGNFTTALVTAAGSLGMSSLYWSVDPRDWDHPHGESHSAHRAKVTARIRAHVRAGSIVLSHDFGQPDTIRAYRSLLPWLSTRFPLTGRP